MSIHTTGRTRTLSWGGSLGGSLRQQTGSAPILDLDGNCTGRTTLPLNAVGTFSASVCGCTVSAGAGPSDSLVDIACSASNGIVSDSEATVGVVPGNVTISQSGSWSVSADVEECYEVVGLNPDLVDAEGYPTFGGAAMRDGPVARGIRFFERLRVGGSITATISSGSLTATATSTITVANRREAGYGLSLGVSGGCINEIRSYSISGGSVQGGWGGGVYSQTETAGVGGKADATVSESAGALSCVLDLDAHNVVPCNDYSAVGAVGATCDRPQVYELSGRALRWTDTYDGVLSAHVKETISTGSNYDSNASGQWAGPTITHGAWSASSTLMGVAQPSASGGRAYGSMRIYLTSASLSARGEDARDWRLLIAGKPYPALSVSHAATTTLVPPMVAEGYRYLRVQHRSVGSSGQSWTLGIGGKTWALTTGGDGAWVTTDLDLCRPSNASATVDAKESRYPLDGVGGRPVDSDYWGVSYVPALTITKPAEVVVGTTALVRQGSAARLSWVPALTPWMSAWTSPADETYHRPHGWSEVDGRVADIPAAFRVDPIGPTDSVSHQTIDQSRSRLAALGGWSASLYGSWPDDYHTGARDAWWLGGGGHVWRGYPSGAWHSEIDHEVDGATTVWASGLWDEVTGYPGIGDAWERADYPTTTGLALPIRWSKILRGQAWGLALVDSATAELRRDSDGANRGAGAADARRFWRTGAPYGQGEVPHRVVVGDAETAAFTVHNRMRHRRVLGLAAGAAWHLSSDGRRGWVYGAESVPDVGVRARRFSWRGGDDHTVLAVDDPLATRAQIGVAPAGYVRLVWEKSNEVRSSRSYDHGQTWESSALIASGTNPAFAVDDRHHIEYVALHNGTAWRCWRKIGAAAWSDVGLIATVDAGTAGLEVSPDPARRLVFVLSVAGSTRRWVSSNWGANWEED